MGSFRQGKINGMIWHLKSAALGDIRSVVQHVCLRLTYLHAHA